MNIYPTPKELAEEALAVLRADQMTPDEHFQMLVDEGIIDSEGNVFLNKLFRDEEPEPGTPAKSQPLDNAKD